MINLCNNWHPALLQHQSFAGDTPEHAPDAVTTQIPGPVIPERRLSGSSLISEHAPDEPSNLLLASEPTLLQQNSCPDGPANDEQLQEDCTLGSQQECSQQRADDPEDDPEDYSEDAVFAGEAIQAGGVPPQYDSGCPKSLRNENSFSFLIMH